MAYAIIQFKIQNSKFKIEFLVLNNNLRHCEERSDAAIYICYARYRRYKRYKRYRRYRRYSVTSVTALQGCNKCNSVTREQRGKRKEQRKIFHLLSFIFYLALHHHRHIIHHPRYQPRNQRVIHHREGSPAPASSLLGNGSYGSHAREI